MATWALSRKVWLLLEEKRLAGLLSPPADPTFPPSLQVSPEGAPLSLVRAPLGFRPLMATINPAFSQIGSAPALGGAARPASLAAGGK